MRHGALPPAWDAALAMQSSEQAHDEDVAASTRMLLDVAAACEGASGRLLRKLPLLTHVAGRGTTCNVREFLATMRAVAAQEAEDRATLQAHVS